MAGVVARSQKLSNVFGASWTFGQMSTIMRCKMSMVHEFELGMISMVDLKHKVRPRSNAGPHHHGVTNLVHYLSTSHPIVDMHHS